MEIVGIKLDDNGKIYYFDAGKLNINVGNTVIVETDRGLQYGLVVGDIKHVDENVSNEYKKILRLTTKNDYKKYLNNLEDAKLAFSKCKELVKNYNLNMKILDANYTFDREQLVFRFLSDDRVDFRQLAKDLGSCFKTRIELRQVGIRDKSKAVGGIGICGRKLCCNSFLNEFDSVSINMAKNQNLSLNPSKINGACGRLLCCLKYENDNYIEYKKDLPEVGNVVKVNGDVGKVISVNIFDKSYKVLLDSSDVVSVSVSDDSKK